MKKRLLITSIVMMLVVAVALSTATYAWFTSNTSVTANTVTMTAHVADASSISIGWVGKTGGTTLAAVGGDALYPMCPTTMTEIVPTTIAFNRADVKADGKFDTPVTSGPSVTPYTWVSSENDQIFYINNDSPAQAVKIDVTATIKDTVTGEALADDTELNPGVTYYTWAETSTGSGIYTATAIAFATDLAGADTNSDNKITVAEAKTKLSATAIYAKKPVAKAVRVAIFASTNAQNTTGETLAPATDFTYMGLLAIGGDGSAKDTAMGTITANTTQPSDVNDKYAASSSVTVINSLGGNKSVYLIVKVWLDGKSFTQAEGTAKATVELNFNASKVGA